MLAPSEATAVQRARADMRAARRSTSGRGPGGAHLLAGEAGRVDRLDTAGVARPLSTQLLRSPEEFGPASATSGTAQANRMPRAPALTASPPPEPVLALQRSAIPVQRDWVPTLESILHQIPGYDMLTLVVGFDPATGRPVRPTPANLVTAVMGLVPGGRFVHDQLAELHVLDEVYQLIAGQLTAHNLTGDRLRHEADAAWEEVHIIDGPSAAMRVVERHLDNITRDVLALANSLVDEVIRIVKEAAIRKAEELLAADETARKIWDLAKAVMHYDPLRGENVNASTEDIIAKFLILIGRETELEQMRAKGTLAQTAQWVDQQIQQFMSIIGEFRSLVDAALQSLTFEQLPHLPDNLSNLATRGLALLDRIASFAATVAQKVLDLIKDSLLGMLDEHAQHTPGFHLLTVLLGRNPLTGRDVPRTPTNIIKGFVMLLPNGEQTYQQLEQTGVVAHAAANIQVAIDNLGITWDGIVQLFTDIWHSLSIDDLVNPIGAFIRIIERFGEPLGRLLQFVVVVLKEVFKLVLRLMGFKEEMLDRIIANAMHAWDKIKADPGQFFNNLLQALKLGFTRFFDHIGSHLLNGLAGWLLDGLKDAGITLPSEFSLQGVMDVILQVLGITVDHLWQKLADKIGPENVARLRRVVDRLSGIWTFIKDVQQRGIIAVWEYIKEKVSGLWNMVLDQAKNWLMTQLIEQAIQKVLSMLDPSGIMAVVNSFMAFFRAVQSVIHYINQIMDIVDRYVATIAEIVDGQLDRGAQQLEDGLARTIPVAIGFLANQVGLGNIGDKIKEIITGIRHYVDLAIEWLIDKAISMGRSVLNMLGVGGGDARGETRLHSEFELGAEEHTMTLEVGAQPVLQMASYREELLAKLRREEGHCGDNVQQLAHVRRLIAETEAFIALVRSRSTSQTAPGTIPNDRDVVRGLLAIVQAVRAYAQLYNVQDIGQRGGSTSDADVPGMIQRAQTALAVAQGRYLQLPPSENEKTFASGGGVTRMSGWGATNLSDPTRQWRPPDSAETDPQAGQQWLEHQAGLHSVGRGVMRALWRGTETLTATRAGSNEVRRRDLVPRRNEELSLEEALDRWHLGNEAEESPPGSPPIDVVQPVRSRTMMRDLLESGVTRRRVRMDGQMWMQEIRVAPDPAPGGIAGVHVPVRHMNDAGMPGRENSSHAEQQVHRLVPGEPIGVSRPMCTPCVNIFRSEAQRLQKILVVVAGLPGGPVEVNVFRPDGSHPRSS
ncbi:MAG TPA: hypothetical protein VFJ85_01965 [Acidimicrobiales bacterium]|nr:hypothetical protein [Acidimicrobiales bacterium]